MFSEISQDMLGAMTTRPKRESGGTSPVQASQSVGSSEAISAAKPPASAAAGGEKPTATEQRQLEEVVDDLNGFAQSVQRQLQFSIDRDNDIGRYEDPNLWMLHAV